MRAGPAAFPAPHPVGGRVPAHQDSHARGRTSGAPALQRLTGWRFGATPHSWLREPIKPRPHPVGGPTPMSRPARRALRRGVSRRCNRLAEQAVKGIEDGEVFQRKRAQRDRRRATDNRPTRLVVRKQALFGHAPHLRPASKPSGPPAHIGRLGATSRLTHDSGTSQIGLDALAPPETGAGRLPSPSRRTSQH